MLLAGDGNGRARNAQRITRDLQLGLRLRLWLRLRPQLLSSPRHNCGTRVHSYCCRCLGTGALHSAPDIVCATVLLDESGTLLLLLLLPTSGVPADPAAAGQREQDCCMLAC